MGNGLPTTPFALPHKRCVTEVVRDRSQGFLGSDQSYRATVLAEGRARTATRFDKAGARLGLTDPSTLLCVANRIREVRWSPSRRAVKTRTNAT